RRAGPSNLMASTAPSTVAFEKNKVLPAPHPQKDATDDCEVVRILRIDRHLGGRTAWKVIVGGVVGNADDGDGPSSWYVCPHILQRASCLELSSCDRIEYVFHLAVENSPR